jgi:TM2 domain-containing membrane protein YozV
MKKTVTLFLCLLAFSAMTFASFHVEKSTVVNNSSSVAVATNQAVATAKAPASAADEKTTIAIILAIVSVVFLPFGLHNWYLGRTKQALWQTLMVFPGFILILPLIASWIWQLVDLIKLLINGTL